MKKNKLVWIMYALMLLFTIGMASATLNNSITNYWAFNEGSGSTATNSIISSVNGSIVDATYTTTHKLGSHALDFGTTSQARYVDFGTGFNYLSGSRTFNLWFKWSATGETDGVITKDDVGSNRNWALMTVGATNKLRFEMQNSANTVFNMDSSGVVNTNDWIMATVVKDGTLFSLYVNGVYQSNFTFTGSYKSTTNKMLVGSFGGGSGGLAFGGLIDEVSFWDKALTNSEITELYNDDTGLAYPFTTTSSNATFTAKNNFNNASITNFSLTIDGTTYTTTNGTITTHILTNSSSLWSVQVTGLADKFFNKNFTNINVSSVNNLGIDQKPLIKVYDVKGNILTGFNVTLDDTSYIFGVDPVPTVVTLTTTTNELYASYLGEFDAEFNKANWFGKTEFFELAVNEEFHINNTFQSQLLFNATDLIGNPVNNFNITINTTTKNNSEYWYLLAGEHTALFSKGGWTSKNQTFTATALDNRTETITNLSNTILNINLTDVITTSLIETETYVSINNNAGYEETFTSANGAHNINFVQGEYSLTLWGQNYAYRYDNITLNATSHSLTYPLYANNSVWITAVDFNTGNTLYNFTVEIYDLNNTYTGNDNNTGTARLNNITSGIYTVRVDKEGYNPAEYILTMTGGSHQTLVAYLATDASTTIFTIVDMISNGVIEGAQTSMYKIVNGTWTLVNSQNSDITGRIQFVYIPNIEYKFVVDADNYAQRTFFLKPLFSSYTIRLTPDLQSIPDSNTGNWYYEINNSGFFYNNQNNTFQISITSGTGTIEYYYLNVTDNDGNVEAVTCITAHGCTDTFLLEIIGASYNDFITVEWIIKESGRSEKHFKRTYLIQDTYMSGTFMSWKDTDDIGDLEKGFVAMIICLVIVGIVSGVAVMAGVPPITPSGLVLAFTVEGLALVGFIPNLSAHMIALGCILIVVFGRGQI